MDIEKAAPGKSYRFLKSPHIFACSSSHSYVQFRWKMCYWDPLTLTGDLEATFLDFVYLGFRVLIGTPKIDVDSSSIPLRVYLISISWS